MKKIKLPVLVALIACLFTAHLFILKNHSRTYAISPYSALMYNYIPDMHVALQSGDIALSIMRMQGCPYPPCFTVAAALQTVYLDAGWLQVTLTSNIFFLLLLLIFSYLLAKELQDELSGFAAVLLIAFYPVTYGLFITGYPMDFALAGIMAMTYYFFLKSDGFRVRTWSLLCAAGCGWGMMMKESFAVFMAGPLLYAGWEALAARRTKKDGSILWNIMLSASFVLLLTLPYYEARLTATLYKFFDESTGSPWYRYGNLQYLTVGLFNRLLSIPFGLALIPGAYFFFKRKPPRVTLPVLLWIAVPYGLLLFMPHWKSSRYFAPLIPALAVMTAVGLRPLLDRPRFRAASVFLVVFGLYQMADLIHGGPLFSRLLIGRLPYFAGYEREDILETRVIRDGDARSLIDRVSGIIIREARASARTGEAPPRRKLILIPSLTGEIALEAKYLQGSLWFQRRTAEITAGVLREEAGVPLAGIDAADYLCMLWPEDGGPVNPDLAGAAYETTMRKYMGSQYSGSFPAGWKRAVAEFRQYKSFPLNHSFTLVLFSKDAGRGAAAGTLP